MMRGFIVAALMLLSVTPRADVALPTAADPSERCRAHFADARREMLAIIPGQEIARVAESRAGPERQSAWRVNLSVTSGTVMAFGVTYSAVEHPRTRSWEDTDYGFTRSVDRAYQHGLGTMFVNWRRSNGRSTRLVELWKRALDRCAGEP
jgi:hypothetical protein